MDSGLSDDAISIYLVYHEVNMFCDWLKHGNSVLIVCNIVAYCATNTIDCGNKVSWEYSSSQRCLMDYTKLFQYIWQNVS